MIAWSLPLRNARAITSACALAWASACGGYTSTVRMVDGETLPGRPVSPRAYALYFDAMLAEAAGKLEAARESYLTAIEFDDEAPELWTRVGSLSCQLKLRSADEEFANALDLDKHYAPAWLEKSRCALRKNQLTQAMSFAREAQLSAPYDFDPTALIAELYVRDSDVKSALRQWVGYVTIKPKDWRAWEAIVQLSHHHNVAPWDTLARRALAAVPSQTSTLDSTASHAALRRAILDDQLDLARSIATSYRLPQALILEQALELGRYELALAQAKLLVPATPESADLWAMGWLAASRAGDRAALDAWLSLPEQLTPLTHQGRRYLELLLKEHGDLQDHVLRREPLEGSP